MTSVTPVSLATIIRHLSGLDAEASLFHLVAPEDIRVELVTADSRQVKAGALFVAIAGDAHDGHRYIGDAINGGAVAIVGTQPASGLLGDGQALPERIPYVRVSNARRALAEASAALHGHPSRSLTVIGVTGTDGKTTTCKLLESMLVEATRSELYPEGRVGVITTVGARIRGQEQETGFHVTTPDAPEVQKTLAQIRDAGCKYAIVESTSHGLAQDRVASVEYDVAAVTNITHEHLDYHGTREAYVQAKALLFRMLYENLGETSEGRFAVLNGDDDGSYAALKAAMAEEDVRHGVSIPRKVYGLGDASNGPLDVAAQSIVYSPSSTSFELRWQGGALPVQTHLIGQFNVQNILCAAAIALSLGVEPQHVQGGIAALPGVSGRMERIDRGQDFLAIVDFAHSPASLERALQALRRLVDYGEGTSGKLIAVFGCAGLRDRQKRRLMGQVSGRLADFTVVTAEDPRTENVDDINREIESGLLEYVRPDKYVIVPDRYEAILYAVRQATAGDVVAAFGKGHERSMCFGYTEYPWSDQQAMTEALDERLYSLAEHRRN